jgi:hypothetical protein
VSCLQKVEDLLFTSEEQYIKTKLICGKVWHFWHDLKFACVENTGIFPKL